ncbi:uncharacterized protein [Salminus brasiliensis]|uniref:uncharacterized protein n=1 Tax=Salminus brasiliensis TaxID=930266 RepID=UPI003B832A7C
MEMACEKTAHELGTEQDLQQDVNIMTQQAEGSLPWIVPKHYSLHEDSSEEDDLVPGQGLNGGYGDCVCCVCGETFTFLNNLIQHFNVHKDEVRCHLCQVTFSRAISLALHLENAHPNYRLFCDSCKVMFWNTWHMNQHMGQHFVGKVEPPDEAFKLPQSETQKPLWLDVEEIIIKTEEVEVKCVKDEEEEVPLRDMQETRESSITRTTKEDHLGDHNYCSTESPRDSSASNQAPAYNTRSSTREQKQNVKTINSEPAHVYNTRPNTKDSEGDWKLLSCLPQTGVEADTYGVVLQATCKAASTTQILGEKHHETEDQETAHKPSLSVSAKVEPVQLELSVKVEDDCEDNLWECAPIEEDIEEVENEENLDIKEESDSTLDNSLYSPMEEPSSETDTASDVSRDYNSATPEEGSIRLLQSRTVKKRQIYRNTNGKSVNPVKPSPTPAKSAYKESSNTSSTVQDNCTDHNYCSIKTLSVSNQEPAYNTRSSSREQSENVDLNGEPNTRDTESEGDQKEKVEVVVLRSLPQSGRVTDSCRVVLQAAYETVIKTQVPGGKPHEPEEQDTTHKSSLSPSVSAKVEPEQLELDVKVEDDSEDNLWERAPIEEDLEEVKDEIKEESDSTQDNSLCSPMEEPSTERDTGFNGNSATPEEGSVRLLRSRTVRKRQICINTNKKSVNSVKIGARPESSSPNEKPLSPVEVTVHPKPSSSNKGSLNSVKPNVAPESSPSKDLQICSSCGLSKVPRMGKPTERCRCMPKSTCYICGAVCGSDQLLLKHQAETHPLTKYICSSCLQVFPNHSSFVVHSCCKTKVPVVTPAKTASNVQNPATMILKFVPSPAVGGSSKQPINNGGSLTVPSSLNMLFSNNVISIVDASQELGGVANSTLPVSVPVTPNGDQKVACITLNGGQDTVTPVFMATRANTGQMQVVIPSSSPANTKPTEMVFQGGVLPQHHQVLDASPLVSTSTSLPMSLSSTSAPVCNQSKVTLRIPTYPSTSNKVSVSFSPTPVQFPKSTLVSASSMKTLPSTSQSFPGNVRPVIIPVPAPAPISSSAATLTHSTTAVQSSISHLDSCISSFPDQVPPPSQDPLRIVTMFVNQSQELALQKRLRQSWRSKTVFPCRHCGAIARQPALGVRHRYQHRGPRLHRCQCGRTFQQRLHLLRHQVQHAEAMRYVCAACGQTFQGTHQLACHKQRVLFRVMPSNTKKLVRRDCRNVFHCNCGQGFTRSSALLWHMLKNSKSCKRFKKASLSSDLAT